MLIRDIGSESASKFSCTFLRRASNVTAGATTWAGFSRLDRLEKNWLPSESKGGKRDLGDMLVKSSCLAHCFRGGRFSGVLWSVWERTFEGGKARPTERWIQCDLLRYSRSNEGWGYKDMEESMHPYFYSCPLGYLEIVPLETFRGQ